MQFVFAKPTNAAWGASEYSDPMPLHGATAIRVSGACSSSDRSMSWTIALHGARDLERWTEIDNWASLARGTFQGAEKSCVGFAWVRVRVTVNGGSRATHTIYGDPCRP